MIKPGQTWSLGDDEGGETIAVVNDLDEDVVEVIVLMSTIPGCTPGTIENFTLSWFHEKGSLLS